MPSKIFSIKILRDFLITCHDRLSSGFPVADQIRLFSVKKNQKTILVCQSCGYQTPKWMGKCPECGAWESFVEEGDSFAQVDSRFSSSRSKPIPIDQVVCDTEERLPSGIGEFDRVLGGGLVKVSCFDRGGSRNRQIDPDAAGFAWGFRARVLYVSGEESRQQVRSKRLRADPLAVVSEIDIDIICRCGNRQARCLVIDSIQTMFTATLPQLPEASARCAK